MTRVPVLCLAAFVIAGCNGGSPTSPTPPPSATPPPAVQVQGQWNFTSTVTSIGGGECIGAALQGLVGASDRGTLSVSQTGASVTAASTSSGPWERCDYTGTAGTSSVLLNASRCDVAAIAGVTCPNGARRDLERVTTTINATVSGAAMSGTTMQSWNVFVAGTRNGLGTVTVNGSFNAARQ